MTWLKGWALSCATVFTGAAAWVQTWQSVVAVALAYSVVAFIIYFEPKTRDDKQLSQIQEKLLNLHDQLNKLRLKVGIRGEL